jgi:hypothetical protein
MLWSAPRSRSTAFFRMMAERGDFTVVHEPFSYLAEFGYAEVDGVRVTSAPDLFAALRSLARTTPVFVKETTGRRYPEVLAEPAFLATDAVHTFLIRHPRETIASYHAMSPDAPLHKIGFESQYEIFAAVRRLTGREPVVVDSGDLMRRPAATVKAYCAMVGIDFRPDALRWRAADRPEWELSRRWHTDVAASTGLGDVGVGGGDGGGGIGGIGGAAGDRGIDVDGHPRLADYLRHHLPYYEMLYARRLRA